MTNDKFEALIKELFDDCINTLCAKGREYQSTTKDGVNVFANFERAAGDLNLLREDVLWVYFSKHRDSISKFIKDLHNKSFEEIDKNLTEPIEGRIMDAINYLLILYGMVKDHRHNIGQNESNNTTLE